MLFIVLSVASGPFFTKTNLLDILDQQSSTLIIAYSRPGFADLARSTFLTVNTSTWIMIAAVVLMGAVLSRTTAGRYMYAAGSNAEAARLAGAP